MAEAFGLVASAGGIVSLGLQVYEGVASYVKGVKDRKPELSAISKQANILQDIVNALHVAAPRIDDILTVNRPPLLASLKTVETELSALKLFLGSLQDVPNQSSSIASRLKEQKRKLSYPFHRPTLEKLQKRLESANNALQLSLQLVNLMTTIIINTTISDIRTIMNSSQSTLTYLQSGTVSMETSLASLALSPSPPPQASMISMDSKLDLLLSRGMTQYDSIGGSLQDVNNNVPHLLQEMQQVASTVQTSAGTIEEAVLQQNLDIRQLRDVMAGPVALPDIIAATMDTVLERRITELRNSLMPVSLSTNKNGVIAAASNPQLLVGRLMSKPSILRDAFAARQLLTSQRRGNTIRSAHRICSCQPRIVTQHWTKKFGNFYAIKKTTTQSRHLPGCEFETEGPKSIADVGTISYIGLRKILSTSLELSMSWTSGAGGFSIGPSLLFRAMVDEADSPVFRLINLMAKSFKDLMDGIDADDQKDGRELERRVLVIEQLVEHSVGAVLKLYQRNSRSLLDVNQYGESSLHRWMKLLSDLVECYWSTKKNYYTDEAKDCFARIAESSVRRLAEKQQTYHTFDYNGNSPVDIILSQSPGYHRFGDFREAMNVLYRHNDENFAKTNEVIQQHCFGTPMYLWSIKQLCDTCPDFAELFGFGPASKAIIMGSLSRLRSILDADPNTIKETNHASQTLFHLAAECSTSEALEILLQAAQNNSIQFDTPNSSGDHALDLAAENSWSRCTGPYNRLQHCKDCVCSRNFDILQSNGWQLSPRHVTSPHSLLSFASRAVGLEIISSIKRAREDFRAAGRRYLSTYQCQRLQLNSQQILDGHFYEVVKFLSETDFDLPQGYRDMLQNRMFATKSSVYHTFSQSGFRSSREMAWIAQLLFENGFDDVNQKDVDGEPPLEKLLAAKATNHWPVGTEIIFWFMQHGADISCAFRPTTSMKELHKPPFTLAHDILPLNSIQRLNIADLNITAEVLRRVAPSLLFDGCCCGCTVAGCNTTTQFFLYLSGIFLEDKKLPSLKYSRKSIYRYKFPSCEAYSLEEVIERLASEARSRPEDNKDHPYLRGNFYAHDQDGTGLHERLSAKIRTPEVDHAEDYNSKQEASTVLQECVRCLSNFLRLMRVEDAVWHHVSQSALRLFTFQALEIRHTCSIVGPRHSHDRQYSEEEITEIQEEDRDLLDLLDTLVQEFVGELEDTGETLDVFLTRYWARRIEEVWADLDATKISNEEVSAAEQLGVVWEDGSISDSYQDQSVTPILSTSERFEALIQQIDDIVEESI